MTVRQAASETIPLYEIYLSLDKQINYLVDILSYVISSISAHLCKIFAASGRTKNHKKILRSQKWRTWTSFKSKLMKTL